MGGFEVTLRSYGIRGAMRGLGLAQAEAQAVLTATLIEEAELLKEALAAVTPEATYDPGFQPGPHAKESYSVEVVGPDRVELRNPRPQTLMLLSGVRAHPIDASNAAYLVFRRSAGGLARVRHVEHPGYDANVAMLNVVLTFTTAARARGRALGTRFAVSWAGYVSLTEDP